MSVSEQNALIRAKDVYGNSLIIYPVTKAENVDGLEELVIQSDWNQNDTTANDYIKNRPFYEFYGYDESAPVFETTLTGTDHYEYNPSYYPSDGDNVAVIYNGQEYILTVAENKVGDDNLIEYPFRIYWGSVSFDTYMDIVTSDDGATIQLYEVSNTTKQIDEKFIPNSIRKIPTHNQGTGTGAEIFNNASKAFGKYSHAEGNLTSASGDYTHAEGYNTEAYGESSHAEGNRTTASGYYSHAEGNRTTASGGSSHAEGYSTTASGESSHTEGELTTASGDCAHAEGNRTTASGKSSHAEGWMTKASGEYSHVQGKFNVDDISNTYAHIVGNGSENKSSNAHTLDWSGNGWFSGDVYVGSTSGTNKDTGSKRLATLEEAQAYVDDVASTKADSTHNHDSVYDTKGSADTALASAKSYADSAATTAANNVKNDLLNGAGAAYDTLKELGDLIDTNADAIDALESVAVGKADASHTHAISDVTGLQSALDGKAASSHGTHVSYSTTAPVMDGTASVGTASTVARSDHKHPIDTSRAAKTDLDSHTSNTTVHITSTERTNWNAAKTHADSAHAPSNAEKNQNAFSNVVVGSTTIAADSATDTLTLAGSNVIITPDATNDKVTIGITKANVTSALGYTPPTTDTTYSAATTSAAGLMSPSDKSKLDGIASEANKTVIDSSLSDTSTNPVQNKVINSAISSKADANNTVITGSFSHNRKSDSVVGDYSHAEGWTVAASGTASHAEGCLTTASGTYGHAEGYNTIAGGMYSHAEGGSTTASGDCSHAEGTSTTASGKYSHAEGNSTTALLNQHAQGHYNNTTAAYAGASSGTGDGTAFVIGNGTTSSSSNAFRVTYSGKPYGKSSYVSSGADYAEFFEWKDTNQNNEDRRGYFVTLDEDKIRIANSDEYTLGVVSGLPSIIGNGDEDWNGRYVFDEFGAYIYETFEYEVEEPVEIINEDTGEVVIENRVVKKEGKKYKENPDYDPSIPYIQRENRPEWDAVGMLGIVSVRDDGTCEVNGYCAVADGGIATASENGYRVIKRVNDNVVKIIFR